ncbi:MAG: anthranilate synthase component I, partial [Pseudooceanicola nanhaiensis]
MSNQTFVTKGGITVTRRETEGTYLESSEALIDRLDSHVGALFSSNYEYPGRYTRWEFGFAEPPLMIEARGRKMAIRALNPRGEVLVAILRPVLEGLEALASVEAVADGLALEVRQPTRVYNEEERSRAPSVFSVLRAITDLFHTEEDHHLGLYGAFGYDLAFQFEPIELKLERP